MATNSSRPTAGDPRIEEHLEQIRHHLAGSLGAARGLTGVPEQDLDVPDATALVHRLSQAYTGNPLASTPHGGNYLAALLVGASRELERAGGHAPDMAARTEHAADLVARAARLPGEMAEPGAEEFGPFAGRWLVTCTADGEVLARVTATGRESALRQARHWTAVRLAEKFLGLTLRHLRAGELLPSELAAIRRGELWPEHPDRTWQYTRGAAC